jgi:hypothetical protein
MSAFPIARAAAKPRTDTAVKISLLYAAILVVFAVAQLFTFDEFIKLVPQFQLPIGEGLTAAIAPMIVASEVFALPFLLRMKLSSGFRYFSMGLGWLVTGLWLGITSWVVITAQPVSTIGFLGTIGHLSPGWWAILVAVGLGILTAWSSWGLWPGARAKK